MLSEATRLFLESTSIRGVGRIFKSQSRFLSRLWALFVFGSTTFLFYSAFKVTIDYLQYDVNIQTRLDIDDVTPFPAVSVCNNQPFSENAFRLWATDAVQSPTKFNRQLRQSGQRLMNATEIVEFYNKMLADGELTEAQNRQLQRIAESYTKALLFTLPMDSSRIYYQNLNASAAAQLGHERNDSFVDCIFKFASAQVQGTRGCHDDMLTVTQFSHPNYFNCFTLQFHESVAHEVLSLALIIWLGPGEDIGLSHRQGFLYDIFDQAYGLRVSVHEAGSHPRILEQGIQTEPGKMNEIKYQASAFVRANTPKIPCLTDSEAKARRFADHGQWYDYDQELCLNTKVQQAFLTTCGCLYVELPLLFPANSTFPYCGFMHDGRLFDRLRCAKNVDQRRLRQHFESTECLPRCTELTFNKELSVTKWRDTRWMIYWIKEVSDRWNSFLKNFNTRFVSAAELQRDLDRLGQYFSLMNITDPALFGNDSLDFNFDERYTYVTIKRRANNTLVRQEKIVLTINALFSRIGGLCSMYIGLTLAFFVECIELVYNLVFNGRWRGSGQQAADKNQVLDLTEATERLAFIERPPPLAEQQQHQNDDQRDGNFIWVRQPAGNSSSGRAASP